MVCRQCRVVVSQHVRIDDFESELELGPSRPKYNSIRIRRAMLSAKSKETPPECRKTLYDKMKSPPVQCSKAIQCVYIESSNQASAERPTWLCNPQPNAPKFKYRPRTFTRSDRELLQPFQSSLGAKVTTVVSLEVVSCPLESFQFPFSLFFEIIRSQSLSHSSLSLSMLAHSL